MFDRPELREIAAKRRQLADAQDAWKRRREETEQRFQRDIAAYRNDVNNALLEGREPPPAPDPKDYQIEGTLDFFRDKIDALAAQEQQVYRAHVVEFGEQLHQASDRVYDDVEPHVEAIEAAAEQLEEIRQQHRLLDNAIGRPMTLWNFSEPVTAARLVAAVIDGTDVMQGIDGDAEPNIAEPTMQIMRGAQPT